MHVNLSFIIDIFCPQFIFELHTKITFLNKCNDRILDLCDLPEIIDPFWYIDFVCSMATWLICEIKGSGQVLGDQILLPLTDM